jgi:hypothetical protein
VAVQPKASIMGATAIDYRIYRAINQFVFHRAWLGHGLSIAEKWAVPVMAVATFALWLWLAHAVVGNGRSAWRVCSVPLQWHC